MAFVHKPAGLAGGIVVQPGASMEDASSGTIETPAGPIDWTRGSDGTVRAHGDNQEFMTAVTSEAGGSSQRRLVFSRDGQAAYLTIEGLIDVPNRTVTLSMTGGLSHLTLVVAGLDLAGRRGTATLTGFLGGPGPEVPASVGAAEAPHPGGPQAIHWAGPVDLGSPWPIHAWPPNAFAPELQMAAFFDPLATDQTGPAVTSAPSGKVAFIDSTEETLEKALAATAIGALLGATGGLGLIGVAIGGLAGFDGVMINADIELYHEWKNQQVDPIPPPPPDVPGEPEEPGTKSSSGSKDDTPPPPPDDPIGDPPMDPPDEPSIGPDPEDPGIGPDPEDPGMGPDPDEGGGGGGGGWKIDDTGPVEHPE
jgi:hypothetical protein